MLLRRMCLPLRRAARHVSSGTVLWSHCGRFGETAAEAEARHGRLLQSVESLRLRTPPATDDGAAAGLSMRSNAGGGPADDGGGGVRCVVVAAGDLPHSVASRLIHLGVDLRYGPSLEEECEDLAPGSGKFAKLWPQLHKWVAVRRLGRRPRGAPVLCVDHTASFHRDVSELLQAAEPPATRAVSGLLAPALPALGALAPAVEASPALLTEASGDDGCVLFHQRWWDGAGDPPAGPGDGESPKPVSKQEEVLRGVVVVALALSIGCAQEGHVAQWQDPLLELLRSDPSAHRSASALCGGFLACPPEDWSRRSSAAGALSLARGGSSFGALPAAVAGRAGRKDASPVVSVGERPQRRLVLYSWHQSRRTSELAGEPGLGCRHEQLLASLRSLRKRAPDAEVRVTTYGELPKKLLARIADLGVEVTPHWLGDYAACLDSVVPTSAQHLEFYPVLHKWFSVVSASPEWDQVLYVDNDTLWADHPDRLFDKYTEHDFYAREGAQAKDSEGSGTLDEQAQCRDLAKQINVSNPLTLFNTGVMLFNRRSWRRAKDQVRAIMVLVLAFSLRIVEALNPGQWDDLQLRAVKEKQDAVRQLCGGALPYPSINVWIREEVAATLALGLAGLSQGIFDKADAAQGLDEKGTSARPAVSHYWSAFTEEFWKDVAPDRYWLPELQQHQEAVLAALWAKNAN